MKEVLEKVYKRTNKFLKNNWWDVRYLLLILMAFFLLRFDKFVKWLVKDTGTVADWVSGLGTIAAFGAVIWQQHRQEKITRALQIEQARPRFRRMIRGQLPDKTDILTNKKIRSQLLYEIVNSPQQDISKVRRGILTLENISKNTIYSLEIIVIYEDKSKQVWAQNGMLANGIVALVPSFLDGKTEPLADTKDRAKLMVRFLTSLNETGFYIYDYESNDEKYFFVKDTYNDMVRAFKQGKMLDDDNKCIKKLNKEFNTQTGKIFLTLPYGLLKARCSK